MGDLTWPPRVLIADDHAAFRSMATRLLEAEGYHVVGVASDGSSAVQAARELQPDLVLVDIQLPDVDGCEVARWLVAVQDPPAVVLISSRDAADYGPRLANCGARIRGQGRSEQSRAGRAITRCVMAPMAAAHRPRRWGPGGNRSVCRLVDLRLRQTHSRG
jgi:DNA-binding NarL/FixJ family response regulator